MAATAGWLRLCFLAVLLALSAFFADSEEVFHVQLYAPSTANSTTGDTCESNFTDISLETGCQLVGGVRAQFDCVDHGQLRLVTGYADVSCTVEASTGYVEETIERTCTQLSSSSEIYLLLKREYPGLVGSKSNTGYLAMLDSPCLTAFEEFEQDLGLELLTIFGLNNITNATDPVLYEVKETLFTYGIVFVAGMILMGLLLCICGYKFFWLTLFISGLAVCGYLGCVHACVFAVVNAKLLLLLHARLRNCLQQMLRVTLCAFGGLENDTRLQVLCVDANYARSGS